LHYVIIIIIIYKFLELGLHAEKEQRVRVLEHRELRKTFGLKGEEKKGTGGDGRVRKFMFCAPPPILFD